MERVESCFSSDMLASAIPSPSFPSSRSRSCSRRVFLRLTLHRSLILCSSSEMLSAACYLRDACCSHFFSLVPVPSPSRPLRRNNSRREFRVSSCFKSYFVSLANLTLGEALTTRTIGLLNHVVALPRRLLYSSSSLSPRSNRSPLALNTW